MRFLSRRPTLLTFGLLLSSALLVASCAPAAQPSPTTAPAKPTEAPAAKPAEKPAATAPAAKPAEKPAAAASPAAKVSVPAGTRLSIATGGTGGVYFPLGGGLATMVQKYLGVQATAEVTPASVDNMKLVNDRRKDLVAFTLADTAFDALQGRERLKDTGPADAVAKMNAKYGNFYTQVLIPKETYKGMAADAAVAGTPNILAVHQEFPEEVAYAVLATIFDHLDEWGGIHPEAKNTKLQTAWKDNPVPLHPGAVRLYRERGVYQGG